MKSVIQLNHYFSVNYRGRHAIIRRLVEKSTGKEFAGKFMVLSDQKEKEFFYSELECLRVLDHKYALKVYDAYETDQSLVLVTELYPFINCSLLYFYT